jgi:hypothetical protein
MGDWRHSSIILDLGSRRWWVVSFTPRPVFSTRKEASLFTMSIDLLYTIIESAFVVTWSVFDFVYIINYYYGSTAHCWALAAFSISWYYIQSVKLLGRGTSLSKGPYVHTEQHKHRINAHNTDIDVLVGFEPTIRAFRESENSSCLKPCGHCDWPEVYIPVYRQNWWFIYFFIVFLSTGNVTPSCSIAPMGNSDSRITKLRCKKSLQKCNYS